MAHETPSRIGVARAILETAGASRVDVHEGMTTPAAAFVAAE
jgi:hypothetical protein